MAISKVQPMRSAEVELIDNANALLVASNTHAQNIATLTEGLADEVSAREQADLAETNARVQAVSGLQAQLGDGFSSTSVTQSLSATNQQVSLLTSDVDTIELWVPSIDAFTERFKLGSVTAAEVAANGTVSSSVTFDAPFATNAEVCVFLCCIGGDEVFTKLDCVLISATYSGFSYAIVNDDSESHTVGLGYVAIQVN